MWHHAFVFVEQLAEFNVYEVYDMRSRGNARTLEPVSSIRGQNIDDAILGLELMLKCLKKKQVFNSVEELDQHYNIGE